MTTVDENDDELDASRRLVNVFAEEEKSKSDKSIIRSASLRAAWRKAKQETYTVSDRIDLVQFGVEVECFFPAETFSRLGLVLGGYHNGAQCPRTVDPQQIGWKCESDENHV